MRYPGGMAARVFVNGVEQSDSAIVYIEVLGLPSPSQNKGDVVRSLNAKAIADEAMGRLSWGSDGDLAATIIKVIAEALDASD